MKNACMVWGASSGAGKSLLTTALCRWAHRQGLNVAPFKAQNMSNNARVVPGLDGGLGEIGSAQYFQALAAGVRPHVDMNPVLLKPERDTASQVVVQGRADLTLSQLPWRERSALLARVARESFERLAAAHDLLVIEGAGSPAEINLASSDYVNLGTARWAQAQGQLHALVVSDIDRGGAFAHLYGTWALLPPDLRGALRGFVLNKFRGDARLLAPGPAQLQELTGVPVLGVLPMTPDHGLPEEDGLAAPAGWSADGPRIAVLAWPHLSNLDEFQPLVAAGLLRWVRSAAELDGADWIVLPGSKQVSGDLAWLRQRGLDTAIVRHADQGRPVLGICGGFQMLGRWLDDPDGVDGEAHGPIPGLGLLPLTTRYAAPKRLRAAPVHCRGLQAPWQALHGLALDAYEIRCGATACEDPAQARPVLFDADDQAVGWQGQGARAQVLGLATHGVFENANALQALFGARVVPLHARLDRLADLLEAALGRAHLTALLDPPRSAGSGA
jgi:adenosylcobyric acid synthase